MRAEWSHKPLNMLWRLTCVKALRKTHCLLPADKTSLQPGVGNEERMWTGNQQGNCKQHRIISSLHFYPLCCGFFVNSMSSHLEKPRRLMLAHSCSGFWWAWSLPEVTILFTDHEVPIKLLICCLRCLSHMLLCRWDESSCTQPCFQDAYRSEWTIKISNKINGL